jgi:23S rRNA (pseudouridine1915-N3)-methyltransferase
VKGPSGFALTVVAVGRARDRPESALVERYLGQVPWPARVVEVRESAQPDRKRREGAALLAAIPAGATVVALDGRGTVLGSEAFARRIAQWRDRGVRDLCFVIGGADGLDEAVLARAAERLSLGAMTWPHLLARAMLAEQLWRAASLLSGHPYHR